ncbi:DUF4230 domain-containing protein [Bizionia sp.]|uniref:DUF4230 domain-containing protein n=1 Tax=Bizionia sp. TaxID=1954480 RepID=UPI003A8F7552
MDILFGLIVGIIIALIAVFYFRSQQVKQQTNTQSVILLDKIKMVCKFISVEGDFAEIYHYENVKERFLSLVSGRKKALVVINAKAHVGFDFSKVKLEANTATKTIILKHFPKPEILSIETNLDYYDKKEGMFNRFQASDLTGLQAEAKKHILDKVPESGLYKLAQREAVEAISLIENLVMTIGWKIDYSAIELPDIEDPKETKELKN